MLEEEQFRFDTQCSFIKERYIEGPVCIITNRRIIVTTNAGLPAENKRIILRGSLGSWNEITFSEIKKVGAGSHWDIIRMLHYVEIYPHENKDWVGSDYWLRLGTRQECDRMAERINQARARWAKT
jgi:hypothetical protein